MFRKMIERSSCMHASFQFSRKMPEREDDHLTPATRLLEKRREMGEVEQALAAQKEVILCSRFHLTFLYVKGTSHCISLFLLHPDTNHQFKFISGISNEDGKFAAKKRRIRKERVPPERIFAKI